MTCTGLLAKSGRIYLNKHALCVSGYVSVLTCTYTFPQKVSVLFSCTLLTGCIMFVRCLGVCVYVHKCLHVPGMAHNFTRQHRARTQGSHQAELHWSWDVPWEETRCQWDKNNTHAPSNSREDGWM